MNKATRGFSALAGIALSLGIAGAVLMSSLATAADIPAAPAKLLWRADRDDPQGMRLLGEYYLQYANRNPEALRKAVFWIERAATVDDHPAQALSSQFYQKGIGVPKNPERATWFAMHAARSGDVDSQFRYALFLETGAGVKPNMPEALSWYRKAADRNHRNAASVLGQYLARNAKTVDAQLEAVRYLSKASRMGDSQAGLVLTKLSARLARVTRQKPNVNIRKLPSLKSEVVAQTSPVKAIYSLGEVAEGWVAVYRPDDAVTGYAFVKALSGS
jgi:hypothetical protein